MNACDGMQPGGRKSEAGPQTAPPCAGAMERRPWDSMVISAAVAAILTAALTLLAVSRFSIAPDEAAHLKTISAMEQLLRQSQEANRTLGAELEAFQRASGGIKTAELHGRGDSHETGRVFVDTGNNRWYFFATDMKPAAAGKSHVLWLIVGQRKIRAGTLKVIGQGEAALQGALPAMAADAPVGLMVTDEPAGNGQTPTGVVQISGQIH